MGRCQKNRADFCQGRSKKTKRLSPRFDGTDNKCGSETNGFSSTECEARKQDVAYMIPVHPAGRFAIICHIQNIQWNTYTHIHIHIHISLGSKVQFLIEVIAAETDRISTCSLPHVTLRSNQFNQFSYTAFSTRARHSKCAKDL